MSITTQLPVHTPFPEILQKAHLKYHGKHFKSDEFHNISFTVAFEVCAEILFFVLWKNTSNSIEAVVAIAIATYAKSKDFEQYVKVQIQVRYTKECDREDIHPTCKDWKSLTIDLLGSSNHIEREKKKWI